jgi:hypothetical protein
VCGYYEPLWIKHEERSLVEAIWRSYMHQNLALLKVKNEKHSITMMKIQYHGF